MLRNLPFVYLRRDYTSPDQPGVIYRVWTITNSCLLRHLGATQKPFDNDNEWDDGPKYA